MGGSSSSSSSSCWPVFSRKEKQEESQDLLFPLRQQQFQKDRQKGKLQKQVVPPSPTPTSVQAPTLVTDCYFCGTAIDQPHKNVEIEIGHEMKTSIRCEDFFRTMNYNTQVQKEFFSNDIGPLMVFAQGQEYTNSFRSGTYKMERVETFSVFSRGTNSRTNFNNPSTSASPGLYWVRDINATQFNEAFRHDFAILRDFNNRLETKQFVFCPKGLLFFSGISGPQTSNKTGETKLGGNEQIFIDPRTSAALTKSTEEYIRSFGSRLLFRHFKDFEKICERNGVFSEQKQLKVDHNLLLAKVQQERKKTQENFDAKWREAKKQWKELESNYATNPHLVNYAKYERILNILNKCDQTLQKVQKLKERAKREALNVWLEIESEDESQVEALDLPAWKTKVMKLPYSYYAKSGNLLNECEKLHPHFKRSLLSSLDQSTLPTTEKLHGMLSNATHTIHQEEVDGKMRFLTVTFRFLYTRQNGNITTHYYLVTYKWCG